MLNKVLICAGTFENKNIGDYIQSVAQEQFFQHIDGFVEREHLDQVISSQRINVIMNGWFMWNPKNFPPASCINPLFISFHLTPKICELFFYKINY